MKMQRKVDSALPVSRDANRRMAKSVAKRVCSPDHANVKPNPRDRKAQYLKKEKEGENQCCLSSRGLRKSIADDSKQWLTHTKTIARPEPDALQSNRDLCNKPSLPLQQRQQQSAKELANCIKIKDDNDDEATTTKIAADETTEEPPVPQPCELKPVVPSSKPMDRKILKHSSNGCDDAAADNDQSIAEDVGTKYLKLLEKYDQQGKLVQVLEEQLSGLRVLIEECTGENQHLVSVLKEKEERETALLTELENVKKDAAKFQEEKERFQEERNIHEQIVKRLNKKLSVFFIFRKSTLEI